MAGNDRTKWNYFFTLNVIEFLNTVTFYKDFNEAERQRIEKENKR